jgi:RNA polymerase sigma factor (sigma-70 family)
LKTKQDLSEEKMLIQFNKLIMKHSHFVHKRYHGKYALEDLVQEAKLGAIKAYRTFDPSKNVKLITHIYNYINFHLSHYTRYDTGLIKIPNAAFSDSRKIPEIVDSEIFQENYINEKCKASSSLDSSVINKILTEEYFDILSEKEKNILCLIYLEGYTFKEVASIYGVSRQFANMTANKALNKIKEKFSNQI